jgi:salicylate 5-hydroxylase large subunit
MDDSGRHSCMISRLAAKVESSEVTDGVASYKAGMKLHDGRFLEVEPEAWWNGPTAVMMTIFPSLIIQQQLNSVSTRQILPVGADKFDFVWTHFGFAEDSPALTEKRLRQANLFGPAGFVSADDGEVIEFVQQGLGQNIGSEAISVLDGIGVQSTDHMVTETLIRGMYKHYRAVMSL